MLELELVNPGRPLLEEPVLIAIERRDKIREKEEGLPLLDPWLLFCGVAAANEMRQNNDSFTLPNWRGRISSVNRE